MAAIRSSNTRPEMAVRRAVHSAGFRFRVHPRDVAGHPDLVLPRYRVAVFVQGCFWHGHGCGIGHIPKSNTAYWTAKLERNRARDERNVGALEDTGWQVVTVWECCLSEHTATLISVLRGQKTKQLGG